MTALWTMSSTASWNETKTDVNQVCQTDYNHPLPQVTALSPLSRTATYNAHLHVQYRPALLLLALLVNLGRFHRKTTLY